MKRTAALVDRVQAPDRGIVALIYHRVGRRTGVSVDLPEWLFEEQISRIAEGRRAVSLEFALAALDAGPPEGPDPVVITFDDGTADFIEVALPILERYQTPAILYLATAFVEQRRTFPDDGRPLSWGSLGDAVSTGLVTIGSHTHSHPVLNRLDRRAVADELDRSIGLIQERLGVGTRHFAYPKAILANPDGEGEVRRRFSSAAVAGTRTNPYRATDPYRLARSPVQVDDGLRFFERKLAGGMRFEETARRLKNAATR